MRTPAFWAKDCLLSRLLAPLGWLYGLGTWLRLALERPYKAGIPVICIGNLTAGGVGKTPLALALAREIEGVAFLSRGYGGKVKGWVQVDLEKHGPEDVGDEALLLAAVAPTFVAADRALGAKAAEKAGAKVIIMDDGLQNPGLYKDLSFIVVDSESGFGNGRLVPAGPLRESPKQGFKRANALILLGDGDFEAPLPLLRAQILPGPEIIELRNKPLLAFAGIGRPEKFLNTLKLNNCIVKEFIPFPDHHYYKREELEEILEKAQKTGLTPVTTEKDMVKIPKDLRFLFSCLSIQAKFANGEEVKNLCSTLNITWKTR